MDNWWHCCHSSPQAAIEQNQLVRHVSGALEQVACRLGPILNALFQHLNVHVIVDQPFTWAHPPNPFGKLAPASRAAQSRSCAHDRMGTEASPVQIYVHCFLDTFAFPGTDPSVFRH
jgi:hypothetical protein